MVTAARLPFSSPAPSMPLSRPPSPRPQVSLLIRRELTERAKGLQPHLGRSHHRAELQPRVHGLWKPNKWVSQARASEEAGRRDGVPGASRPRDPDSLPPQPSRRPSAHSSWWRRQSRNSGRRSCRRRVRPGGADDILPQKRSQRRPSPVGWLMRLKANATCALRPLEPGARVGSELGGAPQGCVPPWADQQHGWPRLHVRCCLQFPAAACRGGRQVGLDTSHVSATLDLTAQGEGRGGSRAGPDPIEIWPLVALNCILFTWERP